MQLIANISMLFEEIPLCERFEAARLAGFDGVEIQFPYAESLNELRYASVESKMPIVLINLPAGDREAGDIGLAARQIDARSFSMAWRNVPNGPRL
jgi:hydroxypyruvate isomerase